MVATTMRQRPKANSKKVKATASTVKARTPKRRPRSGRFAAFSPVSTGGVVSRSIVNNAPVGQSVTTYGMVPRLLQRSEIVRVQNRDVLFELSRPFTTGVTPVGVSQETVMPANLRWANKVAGAYDLYRFVALRVVWAPALPSTASGTIALEFDTQFSVSAVQNVNTIASNRNALATSVWAEACFDVPRQCMSQRPWYQVISGGDPTPPTSAEQSVGQVVLAHDAIALVSAATTGDIVVGRVWLEYTIEFMNASTANNQAIATSLSKTRRDFIDGVEVKPLEG